MMRQIRCAACAAPLLLLLAACATPLPAVPPELSLDGHVCASSPALASAQPVPFDAEKNVSAELDASVCLNAGDGTRSTYAVFKLPEVETPYLLRVASAPLGQTILSPRLVLLDADGRVLRERSRDTFLFHGPALYTALRAHPEERYLVVASDPATVGRKVSYVAGSVQQNMAPAGPVIFLYYTGNEQTNSLVYAHNGKVTVSAQPLPKAE